MKSTARWALLCGSTLISSALGGSATLALDEVIQIAAKAAQKQGYKLENFTAPKVEYEPLEKGSDSWWVFYKGKHLKPGSYFYVMIHDRTKKVEFFDGE